MAVDETQRRRRSRETTAEAPVLAAREAVGASVEHRSVRATVRSSARQGHVSAHASSDGNTRRLSDRHPNRAVAHRRVRERNSELLVGVRTRRVALERCARPSVIFALAIASGFSFTTALWTSGSSIGESETSVAAPQPVSGLSVGQGSPAALRHAPRLTCRRKTPWAVSRPNQQTAVDAGAPDFDQPPRKLAVSRRDAG
jgi:hypothetical protein